MMNEFWNEYLKNNAGSDAKKAKSCICFGTSEKDADAACKKICAGVKRAAVYPRKGYRCSLNGTPEPGDMNIVIDWKGDAVALIETTGIRLIKLGEMTDAICALEGDCATLEEWSEKQLPSIKAEAEELSINFGDDMDLIVEEFHLVYTRNNAMA